MAFFKKLKKLMWWRKREKSGKKVKFAETIEIIGYSNEEVECNTMGLAEVETTNTGKDNNEDVKTNALEVVTEE